MGSYSNKATDHTIETMAQFLLKMPGGVSATGTFGGCQNSNQHDTHFYFTNGIACIRGGMELHISKEGGEYEPVVAGDYMEIFYTTLSRQIEEFCKLIRGEENIATTPEHGRNVISVIEAVLSWRKKGEKLWLKSITMKKQL